MYSRLTYLITSIALFISFPKSYAQTDSTRYDLGRIRLDKKFTQNITIKAADLERQPFSNLSEAINVWLYGTYTRSNNVVYVIDGNLVNDVNIYNIHDIEEITLIQNSLIQVNGAAPLQQLVLIKTRRKRPGKSGFEVAGQANLVTVRNSEGNANVKSTANLFHQYYVSGYNNTDNINSGFSATYLHDVSPILKTPSTDVGAPLSFDRFKLNGYTDVKWGANNTLGATVNFVPQISRFKYVNANINPYVGDPTYSLQTNAADHGRQNLFNTNIQFNSQLAKGLKNTFSATYNHYSYHQHYAFNVQTVSGSNGYRSNYLDSNFHSRKVYLLQDNLSYRKTTGAFTFEPSVNFSYRYTRDSLSNSTYKANYYGNDLNNPGSYFRNTDRSYYKRKNYLLLPSLSILYKNSINLQGGILAMLDTRKSLNLQDTTHLKRIFPFATVSVNISSLTGIKAVGIKLHASYTKQNILSQAGNTQLSGVDPVYANPLVTEIFVGSDYNTQSYPTPGYNPLKAFNNYVAGADIEITKLVSVNYTFERGYLLIPFIYDYTYTGTPISYTVFADTKYTTNRIGLNFNIINKPNTRFISGINTNNINLKTLKLISPVNMGNKIWTGGWVNRLEHNNIFAGLDVLYQTGKGNSAYANATPYPSIIGQGANSFSLQNVYFGCKLKTHQFKNMEVFADGRNLWQNKKSIITDNRRFYGLGFKLGL
ncbi:hypothetical protein LX99_04018 [Mucilaginibacter oryzae]|uniref:Outer membrane receptor protein involved in Fe transport n=1 Tax=Mucilaginibacter oryzae TaxID=468058 RepID=A0A316H2V9_9SPHI|nr:hypothetical protein [Mucilaginibacter oryzae]PWK74217.1 hypothetical protein LX99_04018 [Mucilaginibacter oryzae]